MQVENGMMSMGRAPKLARLCLWALALFALSVPLQSYAQSVEVIVNNAVSPASLNRNLLRAIFTMQLRAWPDGRPVRVFVLPDSNPLSGQFYREQLGIHSYVLRAAWDRMVFTGTGLAPTIVHSEQEMRERVRATPGAIGFVSKRDAAGLRFLPETIIASTTGSRS